MKEDCNAGRQHMNKFQEGERSMSTAYLYIAENIVGKFDQGSVGKEGESK